ncbi:DUF4399 domain-containing protein [Natronolimnohabitans innermongolicus]|uniref:DUF4399 domain-containing protein n=1 Tax=Natronolimnohabitans innermongolicus JCM 12255 TaxID=1227499 RepID=L9WPM4_9EURY|nr:DUF4399 domain-containing protein [Natronolimnohabitans innermongolicus]ELY51156.1 hypothetical protein C493_17631 [Natronolimnohabitans innermongolicus JCM 12255]
MTRTPTRRQWLSGGTVAALATIAGCSDIVEDYDEDESPDDGEEEVPIDDVDHENHDGEVEFVGPEDGAEVSSPVDVELEATEFELQPVEDEGDQDPTPEDGAGHHHVIVDEGCVDPGYVIPHEDGYYHLEDGEEETEVELEPGEYDLCAQTGDAQHNAYDMTDEITIEVVEDDENGADDEDGDEENGTDENGDDGDDET